MPFFIKKSPKQKRAFMAKYYFIGFYLGIPYGQIVIFENTIYNPILA